MSDYEEKNDFMLTPPHLSRRGFLGVAAAVGASLILPGTAHAGPVQAFGGSPIAGGPLSSSQQNNAAFWAQPRVINLKRRQNNEVIHLSYFKDGKIDVEAYHRICWMMRDLKMNKATQIDIRLLDLICAMQAWVGFYGYKKPFFVTSGYRTPEYNRTLEGAARNSMHLYGKAADLIFPDLPVSYLGKLAQHYTAGGVGFYPSSGFVHVDTGRIRSWGK